METELKEGDFVKIKSNYGGLKGAYRLAGAKMKKVFNSSPKIKEIGYLGELYIYKIK